MITTTNQSIRLLITSTLSFPPRFSIPNLILLLTIHPCTHRILIYYYTARMNTITFKQGLMMIPLSVLLDQEYGQDTFLFNQRLQICNDTNQPFQDEGFPPRDSSIGKIQLPKTLGKLEWRRASEIYSSSGAKLFYSGRIEPEDVQQGHLGNCFFLSALSVLAEQPNFILRLFHTSQENPFGLYSIWLNHLGEWANIIVDDYLPIVNSQPIFSRSRHPEFWVCLLEKAYAKVRGSYEALQGGSPADALRALTGAPCDVVYLQGCPNIWDLCAASKQEGCLIVAFTHALEPSGSVIQYGIQPWHAYSLLQCSEKETLDGQKARLLQLRNPWGNQLLFGTFGLSSNLQVMMSQASQQLEQPVRSATFNLTEQEFEKCFKGLCICKSKENYFFNFMQATLDTKKRVVLQLQSESSNHLYLSIHQPIAQLFKNDAKYQFVRIIVVEQFEARQINFVAGAYRADSSVYVECRLKRGTYLVLVEIQEDVGALGLISLSTQSEQRVIIRRTKGVDAYLLACQAIKSYSSLHRDAIKVLTLECDGVPSIEKRIGLVAGLQFFYYINNSRRGLQETITLTNVKGFKVYRDMSDFKNQAFIVRQNSEALVVLTQRHSDSMLANFNYQTASQLLDSLKPMISTSFELEPYFPDYQVVQKQPKTQPNSGRKLPMNSPGRRQIFQNNSTPIEIGGVESKVFRYIDETIGASWNKFLVVVTLINLMLSLVASIKKSQFLEQSILISFVVALMGESLYEQRLFRYIGLAQILCILLDLMTHALSIFEYAIPYPLNEAGGFLSFLNYLQMIMGFFQYICATKFVVHFETAYESIVLPLLDQYLK